MTRSALWQNGVETPPPYLMFGATAGMRNLARSNPQQAEAIMEKVREVLRSDTSLNFLGAEILTGLEEAKYDWVASNGIKGNFVGATREGDQKDWGVMDMGGSSRFGH